MRVSERVLRREGRREYVLDNGSFNNNKKQSPRPELVSPSNTLPYRPTVATSLSEPQPYLFNIIFIEYLSIQITRKIQQITYMYILRAATTR